MRSPPPSARWQCVATYPSRACYCPFCKGTAFEWTDGDSAAYSGDGICRDCRAELSFTDAGSLA